MPRILSVLLLILFVSAGAGAGTTYRRVLVWLDGEPLAETHARSLPPLAGWHRPLRLEDADMQMQRTRLRVHRQETLRRLQQFGFVADGETDVVLHTLMGRMPEDQIEAAASVPGVRSVRAVRLYHPLLDGAVPLIKARDAWLLLGGEDQAGRGLKIAVLDTGIDIANPMLQDARLQIPAGYPKGDATFTNSKVIVARNYLGIVGEPRDTPDAMDRDGHGTFIAAIVAGRRVLAPWAELVGVAPAAQLGNYRIYGSPLYDYTTDAAIIAAINDAVADGMNVINFSSGGFTLDLPAEEPVPQAVAAAAKAGVVFVVAAGNDGPDPATVGDPANSPYAIAVGASHNARLLGNPFRVTAPEPVADALKRFVAVPASGTNVTSTIGPVPLWYLADACSALAPPNDVKGKIAVALDDGNCSRATKVSNIANGGALAAVIARRDSEDPRQMFLSPLPVVPTFQISKDAGDLIQAIPNGNGTAQAAIDSGTASFAVPADVLSSFSSHGPSNDMELKPDMVAPGTNIYSAFQINDGLGGMYSLAQFGMSDGTSFSAPMVAGAAALVKQAHSSWTAMQIKSAVVNTAVAITSGGQPAGALAAGAGRLDVSRAVKAGASFEPTGLSFTSSLLTGPLTVKRTLKITNLGAAADTFTIQVQPVTQLTGATVTATPASLALGARETGAVEVAFQAPPSVSGEASLDGRIDVRSSGSSSTYSIPYWGQVVSSSAIAELFRIRGNGQIGLVSTTLPKPLAAQVYDDWFVPIAGVEVTFEIVSGGGTLSASKVTTDFSGVAPVNLRLPDAPGMVQVKASASANVTRTFTVTARPNPVVPQAGVVNAASYTAAVAPGGIISIFGQGLAAATAQASSLPLPTTLGSATVLFNGQAAPLFYVSPGQINALVPFELTGVTSAQLRVSVLGVVSPPVTVALSATAPGMFTFPALGPAAMVAQHTDYTLVTAANPARPGEVLIAYASGLGAVDPVVASGAGAPTPPAQTRLTPLVQVGSNNARVLFSGLTPGSVGLYQINFEVPSATVAGDSVPVSVTIGGATSNTVTVPVR